MNFPLPVAVVLALSILIQASAAIMAFRLIKITGRRTAWSFITVALMLMAMRRVIPLYRLMTENFAAPPDLLIESVGLVLSTAMAIGIAGIAPLFLERRRAEEELRESEQKYKEIFNNASDSMYLLEVTEDGRFRTIDVNPALAISTGVPPEYAIGKFVDEIKPEAASRAVVAMYQRCLEAGTATTEESELDLLTGRRFYSSSFVPLRNANGRIHRIVVISRDVTEYKRAERERLANLRFFESMDKVNRAVQGARDLDSMMSDVLDVALSIFDCDRAWLVYPCDPEAASYHVPMERTKPEYPGALSKGIEIPIDAEMARIFKTAMASDDPVTFGPGLDNRLPAALTTQFHVQSQLLMAVYPKIGRPYVFGLHQCSYLRVWTLEEKRILREIGRRLADGLTGMSAYRDLRESEGKLEEAQRIAHIGHWDRDLDAGRVTLSEQACLIFGVSPSERVHSLAQWHDRWQELLHPEDRSKATQAVKDALQGGPPYNVEYRVVRPNGEVRIVHSHGEVTRDESGRPCRMFGTMQDITERKRAEKALQDSESKYRIVADNTFDWEFWQSPDGQFVYLSPSFERITGYGAQECMREPSLLRRIIHPEDQELYDRHLSDFHHKQVVGDFEYRLIRLDGSLRWIEHVCQPIFDSDGKYLGVRGSNRDSTQRKQAEEELRRLKDELEQRVRERTTELEVKNRELEKLNKLFVGRELRMAELKKKIQKLSEGNSGVVS
jgi:PAS domain S-box-containing protein